MTTKILNKLMEQTTARVKSLTFHPNKPIIISGHHDGVIKAWDYQMNVCVHDFFDHDGSVRAVLFHPRGDFFVSGGDDKIIRIWNYTEKRVTNRLKGHDDFVRSLDFHPTKPWILSASDDQTVMVWSMLTGKLLATARGHCHYVMSAKFLSENLIVSGSLDQSIRIWDCKGLSSGNKKNTLLPDIVIKQVVDGHSRGVNTLSIGNGIFVSGGDDRDIKIWEWSDTSAWEKDIICNHQASVTGLLCAEKYILSCSEEGLFSVFNIKKRKALEKRLNGRCWCIASKDNIFAIGHDSGFEMYLYMAPSVFYAIPNKVLYLKGFKVMLSDYKTEKVICKVKKDILSIHAEGVHVLVQYSDNFDVFKDEKLIFSSPGKGILLNDDEMIIEKENSVYKTAIEFNKGNFILFTEGKVFKGTSNMIFIVNEKLVTLYFIASNDKKVFNMHFKPLKVICSDQRIALFDDNNISIYDMELNLINNVYELVRITHGFFYEDVFIYATHKHIKYIFNDKGIFKSISKIISPFSFNGELIYFLFNNDIECTDIDMSEVLFKKAVMNEDDITSLIEKGKLPGLASLSYLIDQKKGAVALPYIKDTKQRFELCLSDLRLDECLKYCGDDIEMNRKLANAAMKECRIEIAETCLKKIKDWNMLFMLYVCSNKSKQNKILSIINEVDNVTKLNIMFYIENKDFFKNGFEGLSLKENNMNSLIGEFELLNIHTNKNEKQQNINPSINEDSVEDDKQCSKQVYDSTKYPIDDEMLEKYMEPSINIDEDIERGLLLTTEGKFNKAVRVFKDVIIAIALKIKDSKKNDLYVENRKMVGAYISGLSVERLRRKTESPLKDVVMAEYFYSLPLKKEHRVLACSMAITVFVKHENFEQAKKAAEWLKSEGEVTKIAKKVLHGENLQNKYVLPEGTFCHDVLDVKSKHKTCLLCFINNFNGKLCANCKVGILQ